MAKSKPLAPKAQAKQLEISIYSVIGDSYWDDDSVSAKDVKKLLDGGDFDEIVVRINSPGGSAYDGIAIYNQLAQRKERVIVEIDGLAASAATIVAMAGDEIRIAANAMFMIHDAWIILLGNAQDLTKWSAYLEKLDSQLAKTYAARSKGDVATIKQQMDEETWFTADEAKAAGLVDVVVPAKEISASFDLSAFKRVPADAAARFAQKDGRQFSIAAGPLPLEKLFPSIKDEPMSQSTTAATPAPVPTTAASAPPQAPPAPPAPTAADVTKAKDEGAAAAKAAERERSSKIIALCKQAGKPDEALALVESDLTVADVQAKLFESMCKERVPVGEAGGSGAAPPKADADAEAKKEFKANPHLANVMTEDEYVAQKKRDENHGYVMPKTVAAALAGTN